MKMQTVYFTVLFHEQAASQTSFSAFIPLQFLPISLCKRCSQTPWTRVSPSGPFGQEGKETEQRTRARTAAIMLVGRASSRPGLL